MLVADDLEQVRGESASSEPVRFVRIAFAPPVAESLVLLDRFRVHPRPIVVHPLVLDLLHVGIREDRVGSQARRAAQLIGTLLFDDPQELLQLLGDARSSCRLEALVRRGYYVRHFAEEEVSVNLFEHLVQRCFGGCIAAEDGVDAGRGGAA